MALRVAEMNRGILDDSGEAVKQSLGRALSNQTSFRTCAQRLRALRLQLRLATNATSRNKRHSTG